MARNGDGLFKRRGIWCFRYRDENGQWRERSTGLKVYAAARECRKDFLEKAEAGQLPTELAKRSLEAALQARFEFIEATASASSAAPTRTSLAHLKRILGGKKRLCDITAQDIRRYQVERSRERTRDKKTSPKTINNEVLHLIAVLKEARLWRNLDEDYHPLRVPRQGPGRALMPGDAERLFEVARRKDSWLTAWLCSLFAYSTGCRSYEIKSLQLGNIDLERETVSIQRHKTKTDAGAREVSLGPIALWAVKQLINRALVLGATEPDHYLLPADLSRHTKPNDPLTGRRGFDPTRHQRSWDSAWTAIRKEAGLENFRFHDLRHTYITQGVENGVAIDVIQSQVGHMSPAMVRHYTHLGSGARSNAARKIAESNPALLQMVSADKE